MNIFESYAPKYWDCSLSVMPVLEKGNCVRDWSRWCKRMPDEREMIELVTNYPAHNVSLCTGEASNIIAIDIDLYKGTSEFESLNKLIPYTPSAKIGQKGITYFFKGNSNFKSFKVAGVLDVLWNGCHTLIPPSIHQSTLKPYYWVGEDLMDCYKELPSIGLDVLEKLRVLAKSIEVKRKKSGDADSTGRNTNLFNQALAALGKGKSVNDVVGELINYDRTYHNPPYFSDPKENIKGLSELDFCKGLVERAKGSVVDIVEYLDLSVNDKGIPLNNVDNILRVLDADERFKGRIWYDEFHRKYYTDLFGDKIQEWKDQFDIDLMVLFQRDLGFFKCTDDMINKAIRSVASKNVRNEPKDWVSGVVWDGVERLETILIKAFGCEDNAYHRRLGCNWFISMVARIMNHGCQVDSMPILEGPQGGFKSSALEVIAGKWYHSCHGSVGSKDFLCDIQGKLLVEIAEMDSFNKADVNLIKRVITTRIDRFRPPYDRNAQDFPRTCVFVGTTNDSTYLRDSTGGRRFFPIEVGKIDLGYLKEFRNQIFAEALYNYKLNVDWWTMPVEDTLEIQESRRESDPWEDDVSEYVLGKNIVDIRDILLNGLHIAVQSYDHRMSRRVANILKPLGYKNKGVRSGAVVRKRWVLEYFDYTQS